MRIKGLFWILTALLLSVLAIITYHAFYTESVSLFFLVEGLVLLTVLYCLCSIAVSSSRFISLGTVWSC